MQVDYKGFKIQVNEDGSAAVNGQPFKSAQAAKIAITKGNVQKEVVKLHNVGTSGRASFQSRNAREGRWLQKRTKSSCLVTRKKFKAMMLDINSQW